MDRQGAPPSRRKGGAEDSQRSFLRPACFLPDGGHAVVADAGQTHAVLQSAKRLCGVKRKTAISYRWCQGEGKLQALVYHILPSTTAVFSYAIGSRKLSANEQFFDGAQAVVGLLKTTQIKQCVSFIAANKVYTSTNKTTIV